MVATAAPGQRPRKSPVSPVSLPVPLTSPLSPVLTPAASSFDEPQDKPQCSHYLKPSEQSRLKEIYDASGGLRDFHSIRSLLQHTCGQVLNDEELEDMLEKAKYRIGHCMTLEEFLFVMEMLKKRFEELTNLDTTVEAFIALGGKAKNRGQISTEKLRQTVNDFELTLDIENLINEVDKDNSGFIDYGEFAQLFEAEAQHEQADYLPSKPMRSFLLATKGGALRAFHERALKRMDEMAERMDRGKMKRRTSIPSLLGAENANSRSSLYLGRRKKSFTGANSTRERDQMSPTVKSITVSPTLQNESLPLGPDQKPRDFITAAESDSQSTASCQSGTRDGSRLLESTAISPGGSCRLSKSAMDDSRLTPRATPRGPSDSINDSETVREAVATLNNTSSTELPDPPSPSLTPIEKPSQKAPKPPLPSALNSPAKAKRKPFLVRMEEEIVLRRQRKEEATKKDKVQKRREWDDRWAQPHDCFNERYTADCTPEPRYGAGPTFTAKPPRPAVSPSPLPPIQSVRPMSCPPLGERERRAQQQQWLQGGTLRGTVHHGVKSPRRQTPQKPCPRRRRLPCHSWQ